MRLMRLIDFVERRLELYVYGYCFRFHSIKASTLSDICALLITDEKEQQSSIKSDRRLISRHPGR
jgi:hypothetical protein